MMRYTAIAPASEELWVLCKHRYWRHLQLEALEVLRGAAGSPPGLSPAGSWLPIPRRSQHPSVRSAVSSPRVPGSRLRFAAGGLSWSPGFACSRRENPAGSAGAGGGMRCAEGMSFFPEHRPSLLQTPPPAPLLGKPPHTAIVLRILWDAPRPHLVLHRVFWAGVLPTSYF